jgi:3-deoxy-7-phosphoheptulonate synthase
MIRVGRRAEIGGDEFVTMAGPCSVESEKQIMETAEAWPRGRETAARRSVQAAHFALRFSGHGRGRPQAAGARRARPPGWAMITEVMSDRDVDLVAEYADVMQMGARNMQNFALLKALGAAAVPCC